MFEAIFKNALMRLSLKAAQGLTLASCFSKSLRNSIFKKQFKLIF